jgi:hypothetical protein
MARGTVARGRTVEVPTGVRLVVGTDAGGNPVYGQRSRPCGPGSEVELPADEMARLRVLGFIEDSDKIAPALADGPQYPREPL